MHRSEAEDLVLCAVCSAEISVSRDRGFAFGSESALCFGCALDRGGVWDELHDTWLEAPDVRDLPLEEGG
ncbi:MAG: hypothetical protein HYY06_09250 [Deltaproteobacteria bacterium]|nr:hypothetical protein [Deltaproteobacteria bacterium]